jgi:tetratricopeptide (TPR) repeat protein
MNRGAGNFLFGAAATAILLLAAQNAFAATREQQKWCEGKDDASPDLRITSCTAIIEQQAHTKPTKKQKGQKIEPKGEAYVNRGKAYRAKGDSDHAIRDFDEAIRIDAKDGEAYFNRGLAFRDRGESDRALQDLEIR